MKTRGNLDQSLLYLKTPCLIFHSRKRDCSRTVSSLLLGWLEDVCCHAGGLANCVPAPRGSSVGPAAVLVLLIQQHHLWPVTVCASAAIAAKEHSQVAQQPVVALALGSLSPSWLLVSLRDRKRLPGCWHILNSRLGFAKKGS